MREPRRGGVKEPGATPQAGRPGPRPGLGRRPTVPGAWPQACPARGVAPDMPPGAIPRAGATSHRAWGVAPGSFTPPLRGCYHGLAPQVIGLHTGEAPQGLKPPQMQIAATFPRPEGLGYQTRTPTRCYGDSPVPLACCSGGYSSVLGTLGVFVLAVLYLWALALRQIAPRMITGEQPGPPLCFRLPCSLRR